MKYKNLLLMGFMSVYLNAHAMENPLKSERSPLNAQMSQSSPLTPIENPYLEPFVPARAGTFVKIYDQDQSVAGLGLTEYYLPHNRSNRHPLADKEFILENRIKPTNYKSKDLFSDYTGTFTAAQIRDISIFGTARLGADILRRDYLNMIDLTSGRSSYNVPLKRFYANYKKDVKPLVLYSDAGEDTNAFYNRERDERSASFFHFSHAEDSRITIYTGESSDIVGHEIWGHAELDVMCPWYFDSTSLELGGFHEGHADSMSLTINLSMSPHQRSVLLAQTGGDLHMKGNFLRRLGEHFGAGIGTDSVRDLDMVMSKTDHEVHEIGRIWASGIYDILASAYADAQKNLISLLSEEQILLHTADYVRRLEQLAIILLDSKEPTFSDFASKMNQIAQERVPLTGIAGIDSLPWGIYLKNEFARREISVNGSTGKPNIFNINTPKKQVGVCGTTHRKLTTTTVGDLVSHEKVAE